MTDPLFNSSPLISTDSPWGNNPNSIALGSTVTISRNIERFNFPEKLSLDMRNQIVSLIAPGLTNTNRLKKAKLIRAEELSTVQKEFLVEHFLFDHALNQMGSGEAFILDDSGNFLAILNLQDHLLLHYLDINDEFETSWDKLVKIEMELNQSLNFSFSPKFGFLTSDYNQCGTALIVNIFLHLPGLLYTGRFEEVIKKYSDEGIEYAGLQGHPTDFIGDVISFRNLHTLGVKEESVLSLLRNLATKLLIEEKGARLHLSQEAEHELAATKDRVSRAYAILIHSYQIEEIEALGAISLLKLGLDLQWLQGTSHLNLNKLLFSIRRAHALCATEKKMTQEELLHKRSEFIHQALHGSELLI